MYFFEHNKKLREYVEQELARMEKKARRTKIVRIYNGFGYGRREHIVNRLGYDRKDLMIQNNKIYILADPRLHGLWKEKLEKHRIDEYHLISQELQEVEVNSILVIDILMEFSGQFLRKFAKAYMMVNDEWYLREWQSKC